jgi:hypothetical protein
MDEFRARARLPHLDVEIRHRRLPEDEGEEIQLSLRASPSLEIATRSLMPAAWAWLALSPYVAWQRAMQAWLLAPLRAPLGLPPPDLDQPEDESSPASRNVHPFPAPPQRDR